MTPALPVHIALVDQSGKVGMQSLQELAGALNAQIQRDFVPIWQTPASVGSYSTAPPNTWAVFIQNNLDQPGALGYHSDNNNQPVAFVEYQPPGPEGYSVTVSHETLEMLADPWGSRMHGGDLPQGISPSQVGMSPGQQVQYLLEVCDPPENFSYKIGNEYVSDFILPSWYNAPGQNACYYSHMGSCKQPRQVADGGYVSFGNPFGEWWQVFNENGQLSVQDLGQFNSSEGRSIREWVDRKAREYRAAKLK